VERDAGEGRGCGGGCGVRLSLVNVAGAVEAQDGALRHAEEQQGRRRRDRALQPQREREAIEDDDTITDQFIINTSAKTRTRCLHLIGGCWRRRGFELKNYEEHYSLEGLQYDMVCKTCWPDGPPSVGEVNIDEEDDSSSSSMADDTCGI